jgi:hypothetical protein
MEHWAATVAGGDTVGVQPYRFFSAGGTLVPCDIMTSRQRDAFNLWVTGNVEVLIGLELSQARAEVEQRFGRGRN